MEGLTIKQIADKLKTDKQKVYRSLNRLNIEPIAQDKNRKLYSPDVLTMLEEQFAYKVEIDEKEEARTSEVKYLEEQIDLLKKELTFKNQELEFKNELIRSQNEQIANLTETIKVTQAVQMADKQLLLESKHRTWWPFTRKNKEE